VGNIADLVIINMFHVQHLVNLAAILTSFCRCHMKLGTGLSIFITKRNPSLVTSFALLSCGYLLSSYHEVHFNTSFLNSSCSLCKPYVDTETLTR
jgi:hypothetical protein